MPLGQHLKELRRRIMLSAIGAILGTVAGWFLYDPVYMELQAPFDALNERGQVASLNFSAVASSFDMKIRIAFFIGILVSSPWWIYQLWAFINPGLTSKERRVTLGVAAAAVPLFAAGVYTAWTVIPKAVAILTMFTPEGSWNVVDASTYMKFVTQFLLAFGIAYMVPLFMVVLSMLGVVKGETWLRGWRWAIIIIFVFCAAATPTPDVTTMVLMGLPMIVLYLIAVSISLFADKRIAKRRASVDAELEAAKQEEAAQRAVEVARAERELQSRREERAGRQAVNAPDTDLQSGSSSDPPGKG